MNLCIIPARGGSKRIPGKNIREFCGKPIIAYSIEAAFKSELFSEVMVSTDDEEIADVARQYGAAVPFLRSEKSADDFATLADVMDEVRDAYLEHGKSFRYACCILPTAPFVTVENLKAGLDVLIRNAADSCRPVIRFSYPIQRALRLQDGKVKLFCPEHRTTRSQDLEPAFHDAGQFYWMDLNLGLRGEKRVGFEISPMFVQDIDTEEDWRVAEMKFSFLVDRKK